MLKRLCAAVAAVTMLGCGGSPETPQERLEGPWTFYDASEGCLWFYRFDGSDMGLTYTCELEDGTLGTEAYGGTFTATDDRIAFKVFRSSCESVNVPTSYRYRIDDGVLVLTTPSGVLALEGQGDSGKGGGSSGSAGGKTAYGCYDGDEFEVRPVSDL